MLISKCPDNLHEKYELPGQQCVIRQQTNHLIFFSECYVWQVY